MSLFDKLKQQAGAAAQAAGNVAQTAVQQTKSLAAIGRVKLAIASEEDKMKKAYTELGRLFYRDYEAQTEAAMEDYQPWCDRVADAKAQITRLNEELERIRTEEPEAEAETPAEEAAIEVDLTCQSEAAAEPPAAAETEPAAEEAAEPENVSVPAEETADVPAEPTVETLYVDVTNTEE